MPRKPPSKMDSDDEMPDDEWLPWQRRGLQFLSDDENGRLIYWYYSIVGDVGKTFFKEHLADHHGALVISLGDKVSSLKHRILQHKLKVDASEDDEPFADNPIIVADLSRPTWGAAPGLFAHGPSTS